MGEKKKKKRKSKKQTVDVTLRLNVELAQAKAQPRRERVKRITSRKRPNLREMRRSMPGAGSAGSFANPGFFGNIKGLTDNAMNQFQNQRYSMEADLREAKATQNSRLLAGRDASGAGSDVQRIEQRLDNLIHNTMLSGSGRSSQQLAAAAGVERGRASILQTQDEQRQVNEGYAAEEAAASAKTRATREAEVGRFTDEQLKQKISSLPAFAERDMSPGGIKAGKFKETKSLMQRVLAFGDEADQAELFEQLSGTERMKGRSESTATIGARVKAAKDSPRPKLSPRSDIDSDDEDEPFLSPGASAGSDSD